jgi:hypothetical protein
MQGRLRCCEKASNFIAFSLASFTLQGGPLLLLTLNKGFLMQNNTFFKTAVFVLAVGASSAAFGAQELTKEQQLAELQQKSTELNDQVRKEAKRCHEMGQQDMFPSSGRWGSAPWEKSDKLIDLEKQLKNIDVVIAAHVAAQNQEAK